MKGGRFQFEKKNTNMEIFIERDSKIYSNWEDKFGPKQKV